MNEATEGTCKHLQPQQLSAGVSEGCQILVLGHKLKIEEVISKSLKHALVSHESKNAHSAFNRREAQEALETLAATGPSPRLLVLAHHAISSQFNPIYERSASSSNGLRYLCESCAGRGQRQQHPNQTRSSDRDQRRPEVHRARPQC